MKQHDGSSRAPSRAGIDWAGIHRRIAAAERALAAGASPAPEAAAKILRERARQLANAAERRDADEKRIDVVEFTLAGESYAIEAAFVREVCPLKELTPLPGTPPFIAGIIGVRGRILSVMDIKKLFGLPEEGMADLHTVLIVGRQGVELGILADEAAGLRSIPLSEIAPLPSTLAGTPAGYLRGVTADTLIVLDGARILSDPGIVVRER